MSDMWQVTGDRMGAANAALSPSSHLVTRRPSPVTRQACRAEAERRRAFSLIELLVVLAIMGIMAALAVPALKNFGHADAMIAADQQMLTDVARARQLAISQRTTVYMVFVPANFWNNAEYNSAGAYSTWQGNLTSAQQTAVTNLCNYQLTGYTFVADGALGDQPGQHQWHYLASWQQLPDGTFIFTNKFAQPGTVISSVSMPVFNLWNQAYPRSDQNTIYAFTNLVTMPFPTADSPLLSLPCLAFNYLGQLTLDGQTMLGRHEYIPLARGIVAPAADPNTKAFQLNPPAISENPPGNSVNTYNIIDIDPLTGRATLQEPKLQ
jgi:prepilin-type N-terminal cleavage/methylation domain-containing protein